MATLKTFIVMAAIVASTLTASLALKPPAVLAVAEQGIPTTRARFAVREADRTRTVFARLDLPTGASIEVLADGSLVVLWDPNPDSENVAGYRVYVGTAPGAYSTVYEVTNGETRFVFVDGTPSVRYYVRVSPFNAGGEGPKSPEISAVFGQASSPPPTPAGCQVSDWTLTSAAEWTACLPYGAVAGSQQRQELWNRTVTAPAESGGAACPALTETRIGTQSCTPLVCEPGRNDLRDPPGYPNAIRINITSAPSMISLAKKEGLNVAFRLEAPAAAIVKVTLALVGQGAIAAVLTDDAGVPAGLRASSLGLFPSKVGTAAWTLVAEDLRKCAGRTTVVRNVVVTK